MQHIALEHSQSQAAVNEDLRRYKWIYDHIPLALHLIYRIPLFYYRKFLRESWFSWTNLAPLKAKIEAINPRTILCISHRPAFWLSILKRREKMSFQLWGLLGEYGNTLGWKYMYWDEIDGFLSPLERNKHDYAFPTQLAFKTIDLPARRAFEALADTPGSPQCVLLVCGYLGQGPILRLLRLLLHANHSLRIHAVCGENEAAFDEATREFGDNPNIHIHGAVESLLDLMKEAGSVITKPGISTILETHAAKRKLFLVKGVPVAENHYNARYACSNFAAEWFTVERFRQWQAEVES